MSNGGIPQRSPEREPDELLDREDDDDDREVDEGERQRKIEQEEDERDRRIGQKAGTTDEELEERAEIERRARRLGWKPESEWRGAKDKWTDAATFIERAEANKALARENNDRLHGQIDTLSKQIDTMKAEQKRREEESGKVLNEIVDRFTRVDASAYARARADIEAQQRKAVEDGDTEAYDRATEKLGKLKAPAAMPKVTVGKSGEGEGKDEGNDKNGEGKGKADPQWAAAVQAFREKNPWFDTDPTLNTVAQAIHVKLRRENPEMTPEENMAAVEEEVRARFPDSFENAARRRPGPPQPKERRGGGEGADQRGKRTYENLPPAAKDACDRFIRQIPGFTREKYLATYEWDD